VRLGTVFSNRTETLVVPGDVAARGTDVSVIARLLARKITPSSGPLTIQPGDKLSIRLPADLRQLVVLPGQR
jgi:virulence-associated protein VagC